MGVDNDGLMRAMGAFGGGLGSNGETCGAIVGGIASFGLKYGGVHGKPGDDTTIQAYTEEFLKRFKEDLAKGCIFCRDITGVDWKDEKQVEEYRNSDKPVNCWILVGKTAQLIGEMLERDAPTQQT
ncbi:MAG: C_GCAxxG_C_C family protein [Deltaproteobacteria bacterium]|nr:C_GCAxxG_C_C family protein [Deltaproteobacteria bacterium]